MKKFLCVMLLVVLCLVSACALAELDERGVPEVKWDFAVPLSYIQSKYAILVNENNLLDESYEPDPMVKVTGVKRATSAAVYLEEKAANALKDMFDAAGLVSEYVYINEEGKEKTAKYDENGMVLFLKSGYRSYGTQATTYYNYLSRNNNVDDGYVAKPGSSEHQTGICADILNEEYKKHPTMTQDFKWTPEAQWMKANCADFGFILRFTEDAEDETGIKFEPWHFRYVGKEIATYIMGKGITLEAFTAEAQAAIQDFVSSGGDIDEWLTYEDRKLNSPPESYVLEECDECGDAEVSLVF